VKIFTTISVLLLSVLIWPSSGFASLKPATTSALGAQNRPVSVRSKIPRKILPKQKTIAYGGKYKAGHWYPWGWCTYYAAKKRGGVGWSGNAREWLANAKRAGYKTGHKAKEGAILQTNESWYGHVAYVEKVYPDNSFDISEMNYKGFGIISRRHIKAGDKRIMGFVY